MFHEAEQHPGRWLAPVTELPICFNGAVGVIRTIAKLVNVGALGTQLLLNPRVHGYDVVFAVQASSYAGLNSHYENIETGVIQQPDAFDCAGKPAKVIYPMNIAHILVERSVARSRKAAGRFCQTWDHILRGIEVALNADVDKSP